MSAPSAKNRASDGYSGGGSSGEYYYSDTGSTRTPSYSPYTSQQSYTSTAARTKNNNNTTDRSNTNPTNASAVDADPSHSVNTPHHRHQHQLHNAPRAHQSKSVQHIALEDSLTWCVDGRGIISTLYSLLQNAKTEVYISVSMIDWGLILDEERGITLLDMLAHLCNNEVSLFLLLGERLFQQITIPYELVHPNCIVKFVSQYGPSIKDASIMWVPSMDELISSHRDLPISQFNNKSINQLGETGVFEYNLCYVMVDRKLLLLGPLEFDYTLYGSIGHCVSLDNCIGSSETTDCHGTKKSSQREATRHLPEKQQQQPSYFEQFCSTLWNSVTCNLPETASAMIQGQITQNSRKVGASNQQGKAGAASNMPLVSTTPDLYHR